MVIAGPRCADFFSQSASIPSYGGLWKRQQYNKYFHKLTSIDRSSVLLSRNDHSPLLAELAIVTHAQETKRKPRLMQKTADLFASGSELEAIPVVLLASQDFPPTSSALNTRANLIHYSMGGEIQGLVIRSRIVHLMGGAGRQCLAKTFTGVVSEFSNQNSPDWQSLEIVFHNYLIYGFKMQTTHDIRRFLPNPNQWALGDVSAQGSQNIFRYVETTSGKELMVRVLVSE